MNPAVIYREPREETIVYWERFESTIREASIGYEDKSIGFGCAGFIVGFPRIILFENTLSGWHGPQNDLPFADEEKSRVLKRISDLLICQGFRVRIKVWNPKVRILNIGPED